MEIGSLEDLLNHLARWNSLGDLEVSLCKRYLDAKTGLKLSGDVIRPLMISNHTGARIFVVEPMTTTNVRVLVLEKDGVYLRVSEEPKRFIPSPFSFR